MVGGRPALLARRLTICKTLYLLMRASLSLDSVTSRAWKGGSFSLS